MRAWAPPGVDGLGGVCRKGPAELQKPAVNLNSPSSSGAHQRHLLAATVAFLLGSKPCLRKIHPCSFQPKSRE